MLFVNLFTTYTENLLAPKASEEMQCNTEPENDPAPVPKHREISIQAVPCTCDVNTQFSTQSYSKGKKERNYGFSTRKVTIVLYSCRNSGLYKTCPS